MALRRVSRVRASARRGDGLILLHIFPIGLRSGEEAGRKRTLAPACSMRSKGLVVFVRREIVHDDEAARAESRAEDAAHVGAEDFGVGGSFEGHAGGGTIEPHGGDHGGGVPVPVRGAALDAFAPQSAAAQAGQVRFRGRFVEEDEPRGVEPGLPPLPRAPGLGDVGPRLLAGSECLFLQVMPIFSRA